ncbi:MAG: beta-ketoacyl-ACP synthase III [Solitalea-like symbiont of Acarus siro]
MSQLNAVITAVHSYVPEKILSNEELEQIVDTTNEWIITRTGIKERRILDSKLATSDMCVPVVEGILEKKNLKLQDIDLIICATATPDHAFPSTANIILDKIDSKYIRKSDKQSFKPWGYDLSAACSGFLFALTTGSQFIETGKYKRVIVLGADKMSSIVDYEDRKTCIIFGDGAGGVLLEPGSKDIGIIDTLLYSDGSGRDDLYLKAGGSAYPASIETVSRKDHFLFQSGQKVFKRAVTNMSEAICDILSKNNLKIEDVNYLVPHQANLRIIRTICEKLDMPIEKALITITNYGNTTNASIPLCIHKYEDSLHKNDILILTAFGGGFSWGSMIIKWGYNNKN